MKEVKDNLSSEKTELSGYYVQAGYFPGQALDFVPKPLELAFRYAYLEPNTEVTNWYNDEVTATVNWFFKGHNNKLSADFSYFTIEDPSGESDSATRIRLQWDISF